MKRRTLLTSVLATLAGGLGASSRPSPVEASNQGVYPVTKSDSEWRKILTPAQYEVLRGEGTEAPWSSPLNAEKRAGTFVCAACAQPLFNSDTKYDSGTGWPSFWEPIDGAVGTTRDFKLILPRTEVHCSNCGGHLGHVFGDGPKPSGKRYCMNGVAMAFKTKEA